MADGVVTGSSDGAVGSSAGTSGPTAPAPSIRYLTLKQLKELIEGVYASKERFDKKCFDAKLPRETVRGPWRGGWGWGVSRVVPRCGHLFMVGALSFRSLSVADGAAPVHVPESEVRAEESDRGARLGRHSGVQQVRGRGQRRRGVCQDVAVRDSESCGRGGLEGVCTPTVRPCCCRGRISRSGRCDACW